MHGLVALLSALASDTEGDLDFFERRVRPVLAERCQSCHGPSKQRAGLRLDHISFVQRGSDSGPVVRPGEPDASRLVRAISYDDIDLQMPPRGRLAAPEIEDLTEWVRRGAPWPDEPPPGSADEAPSFDLDARRESHWCWQPLRDAGPPDDPFGASKHPVDRFIRARLAAADLSPSPRADRRTLIRRLSFDLTGLPPTPEEIDAFLSDGEPGAYERLVDRTLASPHFAERQARHWLDLFRYAETYGHEFDYPIDHAWRYRDYLIRAFDAGVPYDQMVREHIAGDLLPRPRRNPADGTTESLIGTAHYFFNQQTHGPVDVRQDELDRIDNQIDVITKAFLGLTVSCARCHDHKFDAISTRDYYALAGVMKSSRRQEAFLDPNGDIERAARSLAADSRAARDAVWRRVTGADTASLAEHLIAAADLRPPATDEHTIEAHDLEVLSVTGGEFRDQDMRAFRGGADWKNQRHLWWTGGRDGDRVVLRFAVERPTRLELALALTKARDYGIVQIWLDDRRVGTPIDLYHPDVVATGPMSIGVHDLERGAHRLTLELVGHNPAAVPARMVGLDYLRMQDLGRTEGHERAVADAARRRFLDAARLTRVAAALHGPDKSGAHPLRALRAVLDEQTKDPSASFATHRERAEAALSATAVNDHAPVSTPFEDFADVDAWFETGHAFGGRATLPGDLRLDGGRIEAVPAGVAHSGLVADRLQGALRSRSFVIEHDEIHYRLKGRGGRVRVIIDGYFMDVFNALLFEGMTFDVDTGGEWRWHRQRVAKYRGHRAHIELLDHGDGYLALDEIRFADGPPPANDARVARDRALLGDPAPRSFAALAHAFVDRLRSAVAAQAAGSPSADADLVAYALDAGLLFDQDTVLDDIAIRWQERAGTLPRPLHALAIQDGDGVDELELVRGRHQNGINPVPRHFLSAIDGRELHPSDGGSGRLELAERILARDNPLAARVAVNRVWHHLFGRGLVRTTDNFGVLGESPTHPELLDWLARWFVDDASWSTRELIRLLVTSETYQQDSRLREPATEARDPTDQLLFRMPVRRLEGEAIRDAMLVAAGELEPARFGEPVAIHLTEFMDGRGRPGRSGPLDGDRRRSIYTEVRRNFLSPMMLAFDAPIPHTTIGQRTVSNVPAQGLILMNDPLVIELAQRFAKHLLEDAGATDAQRLERIFIASLGRPPSDDERQELLAYAHDTTSTDALAVWTDLCHIVFNLKEFVFLP